MMFRSLKVFGVMLSVMSDSLSALSVSSVDASRAALWRGSSSVTADLRQVPTAPFIEVSRTRDMLMRMPSTLDRTVAQSAGPATFERPTVEKKRNQEPVQERKSVRSGGWEVRIYNDGFNTREHVARCLVQVTSLSETAAYQTMMQAHQNGIAVVGRWVYERAEMYHEALKDNGIVCDLVPVDEE